MNKIKNIIFISIFGILCMMVVLHVGLDSNKVKIPVDQKEEVLWDIVFSKDEETNEVIVEYTNNVEFDIPQLFDTIVNDFNITFNKPNEKITYTFYIENKSEFDGYLLQYNKPKIACQNNNDLCVANLDKITYKFLYENGEEVKQNDIIKSKEKKKVYIEIEYKENNEDVIMNLENLGFSLTFAKVK